MTSVNYLLYALLILVMLEGDTTLVIAVTGFLILSKLQQILERLS